MQLGLVHPPGVSCCLHHPGIGKAPQAVNAIMFPSIVPSLYSIHAFWLNSGAFIDAAVSFADSCPLSAASVDDSAPRAVAFGLVVLDFTFVGLGFGTASVF